ncbi:MAG: hypothetical protein QNJ57_13435 [Flavobacteriaceae bacterium]|nr:hypothetical protein [Flavobacteriaceae bacterium]
MQTIENQLLGAPIKQIEMNIIKRYGELFFSKDFDKYVWKGENKYGDAKKPGIWKYVEKEGRIK